MTASYDLIVVGGGIMGCAAALRCAQLGLSVLVLEKAGVGGGASGANAGTLSLQIKRVALMPYAIEGHRIWEEAGAKVGFKRTGGLTLSFTDAEAEQLHERMTAKREAGAPIRFLTRSEVAERAPALCDSVRAASWCDEDGYANSSLTGTYYRGLLADAGVDVIEQCGPMVVARPDDRYIARLHRAVFDAPRILLACGAGLQPALEQLGADIPIRVRVNTVSVTERTRSMLGPVVGHVTGLLTMKQKENGTILIGGGWQGRRDPDTGRGEVDPGTLRENLQLARFVLPDLGQLRIVRSWTGFEVNVADFFPLAGTVPGHDNAFVLGCVRGGYTIGPWIGRLMGDRIAGQEPAMPLFDPARLGDARIQTD